MEKVKACQQLILLRGLPGAGKSTFAATLKMDINGYHFEADMYRDFLGQRIYNPDLNELAHAWCLGMTADKIAHHYNVVVSNTFCTLDRMRLYFDLAKDMNSRGLDVRVTVLHVEGKFGSVHDGVNEEYYKNQWEPYNGEFSV